MSRSQRFRPTGAAVLAGAVIGAMTLAGCGAGQVTQTSTQVPAVVGAHAEVGPIAVRDAQIEFGEQAQGANVYPQGGAAPLQMSIVNAGGQADRLVSANSPAAASVQISGDSEIGPGRVLVIEGAGAAPAPGPADAARPSAGAGASPTAEPGATTGASSPTAPAPATPAAPPAPGTTEGHVVLTGLTQDVRAGLTYPVVLNFEQAGQVTINVPVGYPSEPREDEPAE